MTVEEAILKIRQVGINKETIYTCYVTEKKKPEELTLVEMIPLWLPTEQARKLAMSENPQELYGF